MTKLQNLKVGDKIYICEIDEGCGEWHPFVINDPTDYIPEEDFYKATYEIKTYVVRSIIKRKYFSKRTVYAIEKNEFTCNKKGIFNMNISAWYKDKWDENDTPELYSRTKSGSIYKAIQSFKKSEYYKSEIHIKFLGNLKGQYTKYKKKKQ